MVVSFFEASIFLLDMNIIFLCLKMEGCNKCENILSFSLSDK